MLKTVKWLAAGCLVAALGMILMPVGTGRLANSRLQSLRICDINGTVLREVLSDAEGHGLWVPLTEVSPAARKAVVAIEDHRFYHHPGIDPLAMVRALIVDLRHGRIVSGASTITQQLARQMYGLPRRWYAKPIEVLLAMRLELYLSKEQILEQYLNRAPFGNQIFGIEAASRIYLDKPAAHLAWFEAAFLAGLPQSPVRYNPYADMGAALRRQQRVLRQLRALGFITQEEFEAARLAELKVVPHERAFAAPHFCQMVLEKRTPDEKSPDGRIITTLDLPLQRRIEDLVTGHLSRLARQQVTNAAVLVIDNRSNSVKVWVGSCDFFNERHQGQVDGVRALRQPGSAIKTFTYGLALENGFTAASILPDIETHAATLGGDFTVHNYDEKYHGPVRLRTALACSYNVATVRLLETLGADLLLQRLRLAGMTMLDKPASYYGLGLTLGNGEVSLMDLTVAYAALARGGEWRPLVYDFQPVAGKPVTIFQPAVVYILSDILSDPMARAPAFGIGGPLRLPFPCAAKTGTSKDFRDNWTLGYTSEYTVGVWVGNFDGAPMEKISGITGAAPLFRDIMLTLHEKREALPPVRPAGLERKIICPLSGALRGKNCPGSMEEWFLTGTAPREECHVHQRLWIDRRSGLLAGPATPAAKVQSRVYEIWPPEYQQWAQDCGMPPPPVQQTNAIGTILAISFPDEGDIFKIDPILRRSYQALTFEVVAPPGMNQVSLFLNDSLLTRMQQPFRYRWPLRQGAHSLRAEGRWGEGTVASRPVHFQVF